MSHEEILKKVKEYYEEEYQDTKRCFEINWNWSTPQELINGSIKRCLGVAQFVQNLGVAYEDIGPIYMEYKEKLENLLTTE